MDTGNIKFATVKNKGCSVNKTGKPRKTRTGNGVMLLHSLGVPINDEMKDFITAECLTGKMKPTEFVRSLLKEAMLERNYDHKREEKIGKVEDSNT